MVARKVHDEAGPSPRERGSLSYLSHWLKRGKTQLDYIVKEG
jgi:hypothetical protein